MGNSQTRDYKKELHHRLLAVGISDDEFLGTFFERWGRDIEGSSEDELESWIETAENDYHHWYLRFSRVQEGDIPPKKALMKMRRARKPKDIAGAWERQEALAHYLEEVTSGDEDIIRFRERAMAGRRLSEEQALAFLSSPLLADQSLFVLDGMNISLLEENHLLEEEADKEGPYRRIVIEGQRRWKVRPLAAKGPELVFPGDVVGLQDLLGLRAVRAITFPHPCKGDQLVMARQGSVIAELLKLAEHSLEGYPISREMGVWFILTGEFSHEDPVRIRYRTIQRPELSRTTITLEVESWLPPEDVLEQYRHAQDQILGRTPRSLKRKTVALFKFVHRHKGEKSWGELFRAWNKAHRDQRFRDRSHLFTTYMRALEYIAGVKPTRDNDGKQLKMAGTDSHGWPIIADKWYILHQEGYTALFDSREEAEAAPRSEGFEVLTAEQLVARLAERTENNQPSS